jgi:hypothetical protein
MMDQYVVDYTLGKWEEFGEWVQPGALDNGYFIFTELVEFFEALAARGDIELTETDLSIIQVLRGMRNLMEQRLRIKGYVRNHPDKDYGEPLRGDATVSKVITSLFWEVEDGPINKSCESPEEEAGDMFMMLRVLGRTLGVNIDQQAALKFVAMDNKRKARNAPYRRWLNGETEGLTTLDGLENDGD